MSENSISTVETASDGIIKLAGRLLVATVWLSTILFGLFITTAFLMLATYFFTKHYWGPAIIDLITG